MNQSLSTGWVKYVGGGIFLTIWSTLVAMIGAFYTNYPIFLIIPDITSVFAMIILVSLLVVIMILITIYIRMTDSYVLDEVRQKIPPAGIDILYKNIGGPRTWLNYFALSVIVVLSVKLGWPFLTILWATYLLATLSVVTLLTSILSKLQKEQEESI